MVKQKDVAVVKTNAVPAIFQEDLEANAGGGMEGATSEDMTIPFLVIMQDLTPEAKKRDPAYIDGAEPSMFFNTALRRIYSGEVGLRIVPVFYRRSYKEWVPRAGGGGFVGERDATILEQTTRNDRGKDVLATGNEIVTSGDWYCLVLHDDGTVDQVVVAMSSTQLKKSRRMLTMLKNVQLPRSSGKGTFNPPMWYNIVKIVSVPESNDQGSWFGFDSSLDGNLGSLDEEVGRQVMDMAKAFGEAVSSGAVRASPPPSEGGSADAPVAGDEGGDEIPFD